MDRDTMIAWLLEVGGPVVRYRAAVELAGGVAALERERLASRLLDSAPVQRALPYLVPSPGHHPLHGSRRDCFENAMGRLILLGCRAGMPPLDEGTRRYRDWLADQIAHPTGEPFSGWYTAMVAAFLVMAGYRDAAARSVLLDRLAETAAFCREGRYDIYVDRCGYVGYPEAFHRYRLINPAIYGAQVAQLPSIHDLNGLAALLVEEGNPALWSNLEAVTAYVLHPAYHALDDGYGVVWGGGRRYYTLGWDAKMPGFHGFAPPTRPSPLLTRLITIARIPAARAHPWFRSALAHLETFRTPRGTFRFPPEYLTDREGYWVLGYGLGVGENRRSPRWREIESTLWHAWIATLAGE